jgi:hypothetical protein
VTADVAGTATAMKRARVFVVLHFGPAPGAVGFCVPAV